MVTPKSWTLGLFFLAWGWTTPLLAQKLVVELTPEEVASRVLTKSSQAFEINANAELSRLTLARVLGVYDFTFLAETGFEKSKIETSFSPTSNLDETQKTTLSLSKPLVTGTLLTAEYSHSSLKSDLTATAPSSLRSESESRLAGITLTQNLWKNYFGQSDRADLQAATKSLSAAQMLRINDLENLVLNALKAYWKATVAQENFQESLNSRDRYLKLVEAVRKKQGYGYANPGELSQVQAEYEIRLSNVKTASVEYLAAVDQLNTLLDYPQGTELKFQYQTKVSAPTQKNEVRPQSLRSIQAAQLKKEAAVASYRSTKARQRADLSFVAKIYSGGLDESASGATSEMLSASNPKTYFGFKFQTTFGNDTQSEEILNKRLTKEIEESKYERTQRETLDQIASLGRQVQSTYSVVISSQNQKELREQVVQELNRTYNQGRTDISVLIDALNKYFTSEIQLIKAVGDYQIALNELAAARDELIHENQAYSDVQVEKVSQPENGDAK